MIDGTSGAPIGGWAGVKGARVLTTEGAGNNVGLGGAAGIPVGGEEYGGSRGGERNRAFASRSSSEISGQDGGNGTAAAAPSGAAGVPPDAEPTVVCALPA